jgi:hypothetical protein
MREMGAHDHTDHTRYDPSNPYAGLNKSSPYASLITSRLIASSLITHHSIKN